MSKRIVLALAFSAVSTLAYAQSPAAPAPGLAAPKPPASATAGSQDANTTAVPNTGGVVSTGPAASADGIQLSNTAAGPVKFVVAGSTDLLASKLIGTTVYDTQGDSVGTVADVVLKGGASVSGVILSVGGFLGIGDSYVVVDPATISVSVQNGAMRATVDATRDALSSAPKFTYPKP